MSSCNRRNLLRLGAAVPLLAAASACGFTPAYGPGGAGTMLQDKVRIPDPNTHDSYLLVENLEQELGRATAPVYDLKMALRVSTDRLAISKSNTTLRFNLVGTLDYTLKDIETGKVIGKGQVNNFAGYSATGTTVATQAAAAAAHESLMQILSDALIVRMMADVANASKSADTSGS